MSDANPFSDPNFGSNLVAPPSAPPADSSNPFSDPKFGMTAAQSSATATAPVSTAGDVTKSLASGVSSGVQGLLGLPGDIAYGSDYGPLWAEGKVREMAGALPNGQSASDFAHQELAKRYAVMTATIPTTSDVNSAADAIGIPKYQPQTKPGDYAYTIGSFLPGAAAAPFEGPVGLAGNLGKFGVAAGAASETAGQLTKGTALEPWARAGAGILGGAAADVAGLAATQGAQAARTFARPFGAEGQKDIAAATVRGEFTDPNAAVNALQTAPSISGGSIGETVPGSKPTTGQVTGDLGALSMERELATLQPDLYKENQFGTGSVQQNAARAGALQGIQPGGSPADVGDFLRQQMAALTATEDAKVAQATRAATQAATGLGTGAAPEDTGAALRAALQQARDGTKAAERPLWQAVDPDGTLTLPADPVILSANKVLAGMPKSARPMQGEEAAIFDTASNFPAVAPFSEMVALRGRISTELREELDRSGQSPAYNRLTQLRGAVEDAIENGAAHKAASDQAAVAAGQMTPSDTLGSRLNAVFDQSAAGPGTGQNSGAGIAQAGAASAPQTPGGGGAGGAGARGPGNAPGGQPVPGNVARSPAASPVNWDRSTIGSGQPLPANMTVVDAPVNALDAAFKRGAPDFYVDAPKPQVAAHAASGAPMSLPEIGVVDGNLGFNNGRNRFAAARDAGAQTIPIAVEKDNVGAVTAALQRPQGVLGPGTVYYPSGSLGVNYEVANLPSLITSHDTNFRVNPQFPAELQPRSRQTAPAQDQVNSMAARLQPERLGPSPEANSGAPIVGPDNVVESGNGRTLALAKAYQSGAGGDYRNWLASQGVDTAGIPSPVLIARRTTPLSPEDRIAFTHSANTASGLRMNAAEQAAADARLITPDALSSIADGSPVNSAENRPFVRSFLSQLSPAERGGLLDAGGNLSQPGVRRVEAAMASRAYGDSDFVARAFDAADPNIRGLAGGMVDASGPWMKMRQAARDGLIDPGHDITPDLMSATRAVMRARNEGRPVSEVLNQGDMFGGETSALAKRLILNDSGAVASREQIADRLRKYATEAQKNLAAPSLFGDKIAPAQVLRTSLGQPPRAAVAQPAPVSAAMKGAPAANFDAGAAARLKTASAFTKARAGTFDSGPVGDFLRKQGNATTYKAAASSGPARFWAAGPSGAERVKAFRAAAGFVGPGNMNPLLDAAAESFRREVAPQGIADPASFAKWQTKYQDALREMPADLKAKFSTASGAAEVVAQAAEARKLALDGFQKSIAGKVAGVTAGQDITKMVGGIFGTQTADRDMSALARRVSADPVAREGLRKALSDAIVAKAMGTTEAGTSGVNNINGSVLQKFVRDNASTIKAAGFTDQEVGLMQAIGQDLQRGQRTLSATRLPGQSNTAQDIVKAIKGAHEGHGLSLMSKIAYGAGTGVAEGGMHGAVVGGALGAIEHLSEHLVSNLRAAGLAKANALVADAFRSPELALELLKRAPIAPGRGSEYTLAKMLARNSMFDATAAHQAPADSHKAATPRAVRPNEAAHLVRRTLSLYGAH